MAAKRHGPSATDVAPTPLVRLIRCLCSLYYYSIVVVLLSYYYRIRSIVLLLSYHCTFSYSIISVIMVSLWYIIILLWYVILLLLHCCTIIIVLLCYCYTFLCYYNVRLLYSYYGIHRVITSYMYIYYICRLGWRGRGPGLGQVPVATTPGRTVCPLQVLLA